MTPKTKKVPVAFERKGIVLPLERIIPRKTIKPSTMKTPRYQRIAASMRKLGLIEPLFVFPEQGRTGNYILLDGHFRWQDLKDQGAKAAFCLIAKDDEAFTYNYHVCAMTPLQEHFMIKRAIDKGVSEEQIAETLNVDVKSIYKKRDLTKGVCREAVEMLKDRMMSPNVFAELRRVQPMRQIEIAELMKASHTYTLNYVKCLIESTPAEQFNGDANRNGHPRLTPGDIARMRREMESISGDMRRLEETHGQNVLHLVIAIGYVKRLLSNANCVKFLSRRYGELLVQLQELTELVSLSGAVPSEPVAPS